MFSGNARIAGVIGWPVTHSLSPRLHQYWLFKHRIDGVYIPLSVNPENLKEVIRALPKMGIRGCNITIPHKENVIPLLDSVDDTALAIGAVNTIVVDNGMLRGMNTDAYGFQENLRHHAVFTQGKRKAVVLGAGGVARAVCYALREEGFDRIFVANRSPGKAETLTAHFGTRFSAVAWQDYPSMLADADILVNATSIGLAGQNHDIIKHTMLPEHAIVADTVYTPLMTPLLVQAKARGHTIVDGLGMLIHQAIPGFAAWFGIRPEDSDDLRRHLKDVL